MSNISRFFLDNYIWILVIILLTIVTIIGFLVDKKRNNKKEDNVDNTNANGVVNPNVQTNAINYNPNMPVQKAVNNVIPNVQLNQNNNQGPIIGTIPNGVAMANMDIPTNNYQPLSEQTPQVAPQPTIIQPQPNNLTNVTPINNVVQTENSTIPQAVPMNVNSVPNMMNNVPVYNQNNNNTVANPLNAIPNANNNQMVPNNNLPNYNINPVNNNQNDYQQVNNISQPNIIPMIQNTNLPNGTIPNNNVMPQVNIPNVNGQAVNFVYGPQGNNQN